MTFRAYQPERDREAVHRIMQEAGWLERGKEDAADIFLQAGDQLVAEINGEAECLVQTAPGDIRYLDDDLPFSGVLSVATSRVARKQGFAKRLTALAVAKGAAKGALVAGLGMFEQGFYNQLGFGSGGYEHNVAFDPAHLNVGEKARLPRRITADDWAIVHASRLSRYRGHGALRFTQPETVRSEMLWAEKGFGLGYNDGPNGELTHHFWADIKDVENGPYNLWWMAYQNTSQLLELLALIRNLGDQVRLVTMQEPRDIQFQDLLERPFYRRQISEKSRFESGIRAMASWQMRMCDLPGCLQRTHLWGDEIRFNLRLTDPIAALLDRDAPWHGIGGDYVVTLGPSSDAISGTDLALPTLAASVGAFTRLWLGVRPATGLAATDHISAPQELLERLDLLLRLPEPKPDWDF